MAVDVANSLEFREDQLRRLRAVLTTVPQTSGSEILSQINIKLERINFDQIRSNGYCYQIEMAFAIEHLNRNQGSRTEEIPITFIERENGVSKMSLRIVLEAIWQVTKMGLRLRFRPTADKLHYVK